MDLWININYINWDLSDFLDFHSLSSNIKKYITLSEGKWEIWDKENSWQIVEVLKGEYKKIELNCQALKVGGTEEFVWRSYPVYDWIEDIKLRINKLQIFQKRTKLQVLEDRLNKIVSPELRAELELEAIAKELG